MNTRKKTITEIKNVSCLNNSLIKIEPLSVKLNKVDVAVVVEVRKSILIDLVIHRNKIKNHPFIGWFLKPLQLI
jgi:hypothetical protein